MPRRKQSQQEKTSASSKQDIHKAARTQFPYPFDSTPSSFSEEEKMELIAVRFREIMQILGLNVEDESLSRTPYRVAKMYVKEIFSGLNLDSFPQMSFIEENFHHQDHAQMVFVNVNFNSFCEHHFVPMNGTAYVAYLPNKKIIGLSKIPRIVRFFASRPQVQERLTAQIADSLSVLLETESVAVSLTAQHFCIIARGIEDSESHATTNVLRGQFQSNEARRSEFFEAINRRTS